jgi:Flp pilus assembly pilin Flp
MNKLTTPRRIQLKLDPAAEDGQTMAEYSVVLTLIIVVFGIAAFFVLATAIIGELDRITGILS